MIILLYKCSSSTSEILVAYTIEIKSYNGSVLQSYNGRCFISSKERESIIDCKKIGRLENDTLIIFFKARMAKDSIAEAEVQTSMSNTSETLSKDFENIYISGCYSDILIDVKGKKFSAHRSILSSRSSVFRSMLELDMKEKGTGLVNITDCDPESFESFLLFLYSGKLDIVTSDNALGLYVTAEKYNVQDLKKACREFMTEYFCVDSICDVLSLAALYEEQELLNNATAYFVKNAREILKTLNWQILVEENFTLANDLLIKIAEKLPDNI